MLLFFLWAFSPQLFAAAVERPVENLSDFHKACFLGNIKSLRSMIKKNLLTEQVLLSFTETGKTSLHVLAEGSNKSVASHAEFKKAFSFLVKKNGVQKIINIQDKEKNTPLMIAIKGENTFLAKIFLHNCAFFGFEIKDKQGKTALDLAKEKEHIFKDILDEYS